jgi:Reverse transcriptase (RNA-dependent DNA polymerase)
MVVTNSNYSVWVSQKHDLILVLYVDDIMLFVRDIRTIQWIKDILNVSFSIKDLGPILIVLGIRIRRDRVRKTL